MADDSISLREHIEALLAEKDKAINAALLAAEKAVAKAETANERRFEAVNEFRQTLSDQATTFVTKADLDAANERVRDLASRLERMEGQALGSVTARGAMSDSVKVLVGLGTLLIAIVGIWLATSG
jgi:hypothetical protein